MIRILVVSKSELYFRILQPFLRDQGIEICGIHSLPVDIMVHYAVYKADIIVLDANWNKLPVTGAEILQRLLAFNPTLKIITVTNSPEIEAMQRMKSLGASGYFYRTANKSEGIISCIKSVARGEPYFLHPAVDITGTVRHIQDL